MSHEIYYTSAPEGLKRGASGFCTVAASDNIPRALLERLETLSAYRHHFSMNAGDGVPGGGAGGVNPVSHAHWILSVTGKTYHVLSRVCDSGVDHTQRTNAFAHHLVLETAEIEAAPAGPAWMLDQPGVMANVWDGKVGALTRSRLPQGDNASADRICRGWAGVTGDAGWGGHLADLFVKSPTRPVCILFSPGQDLLGLLAEAVGLLPPAARWNVTFNTYFTSMPTSATCLWRCCLAGTPAAQLGLRYAASGLVLDLTDRARLPVLPAGAYVTMARTGAPVEPPVKPAMKPARPAQSAPPKDKPAKLPTLDLDDDEEEEMERRRDAIFELADEVESPEVPEEHAEGASAAPAWPDDRGVPAKIKPVTDLTIPGRVSRPLRDAKKTARTVRGADAALQVAEAEADRAAARRRQHVMYLFAGALAAIAVGTGLVFLAYRNSAPPEIPMHSRDRGPRAVVPEDVSPPVPAPHEDVPEVVNVPPAPVPVPETSPVSPIAPTAPAAPSAAPVYPAIITLTLPIDRPNAGTGIGDRTQVFPLRAADIDGAASITGLRLHLPEPATHPGKPDLPLKPAAQPNAYANQALGTILALDEPRNNRPGVAIKWKSPADAGAPTEIMYLAFDRNRPALEMQWHAAALVKDPKLVPFIYWVLQSSTLELEGAREVSQKVAFKPFDPPVISLNEPTFAITWPVELPLEAAAVPPHALSLPAGWEASWYPDWEVKDPAMRSPANASQVLKFKKPTNSGAVDAWFLVTFRPGLANNECTFAKRLASDEADLADAESKLRAAEGKIQEVKADNRWGNGDSPGAKELLDDRDQCAQLVEAYKTAVAAYHEITRFDVAFDLPDGLRLAALHFQQIEKPADTGK